MVRKTHSIRLMQVAEDYAKARRAGHSGQPERQLLESTIRDVLEDAGHDAIIDRAAMAAARVIPGKLDQHPGSTWEYWRNVVVAVLGSVVDHRAAFNDECVERTTDLVLDARGIPRQGSHRDDWERTVRDVLEAAEGIGK